MDLDSALSTIATIGEYIPEDIGQAITSAAAKLPREINDTLKYAVSYLPAQIDLGNTALFILYFSAAVMIMGLLGRVTLGKRSSLNRSLSSSIGILFIYVLTVIVYTFKPWNLDDFLSPLPFVRFSEEYLFIMPIAGTRFPVLCSEILSLIILAFVVNLLDTILPNGESFISWYLMRFLTVVFSMVLHFFVRRALHQYLPNVLVTYAPTVLLVVLVFFLMSGVVSLILGLIISVANPFLGAMYTFFFSNVVGKQLSKAVFSSMVLCAIVYLLEFFGYTVLCITVEALLAYIPLVLILLVLWYLLGHVL